MKLLFACLYFCTFLCYKSLAQSSNYTIESFQGVYSELTNYESTGILAWGNPLFEIEFPLDFQFFFYDSLYTSIIYRGEAWGSLTDDQDVALFLMLFTRGYAWDDLNDTSNITSDIRFSHIIFNNMQAFVLQFTKMRFFVDPYADEFDTYFNFQIWFYENGVMEVRFGEIHMDNTPIYEPGKGFYCYTTSGGVDTNEMCGPYMGISNPLDEEDAIALSGSYDDYEVTEELYSVLTELPPHGWVIRFKPRHVSIFDPRPDFLPLAIHPNPASSFIALDATGAQVTLYDISGRIWLEEIPQDNQLDISAIPPGMYFVQARSDGGITVGKFLKE